MPKLLTADVSSKWKAFYMFLLATFLGVLVQSAQSGLIILSFHDAWVVLLYPTILAGVSYIINNWVVLAAKLESMGLKSTLIGAIAITLNVCYQLMYAHPKVASFTDFWTWYLYPVIITLAAYYFKWLTTSQQSVAIQKT